MGVPVGAAGWWDMALALKPHPQNLIPLAYSLTPYLSLLLLVPQPCISALRPQPSTFSPQPGATCVILHPSSLLPPPYSFKPKPSALNPQLYAFSLTSLPS